MEDKHIVKSESHRDTLRYAGRLLIIVDDMIGDLASSMARATPGYKEPEPSVWGLEDDVAEIIHKIETLVSDTGEWKPLYDD